MEKNQHISMIKQACKAGELRKLIKNCKCLVTDYITYYKDTNIHTFFQREYFIAEYRHTFCVSYKILKYLENPTVYAKYEKLNNKHRKKY